MPAMNLETVAEKIQGTRISDMSKEQLMELFEAIARRAADNALKSVGLNDEDALKDIRDMRDLLKGYRVVRKGALQQLGRIAMWIVVLSMMGLVYNSKTTTEIVKVLPTLTGG
jgi:hypothetical protein